MYSVKPGRGPSLMGGIAAIAVAIGGVFWIILANGIGAPGFFTAFGVIFVLLVIIGAIYNFANAAGKERMSAFDVTTGDEEGDPVARAFGHGAPKTEKRGQPSAAGPRRFDGDFCPFCGHKLEGDFDYCPKCGRDV
jgi:hypothetical protein